MSAPLVVTNDGEVPFASPVAGVAPTASAHFATRGWVESSITFAALAPAGGGDPGVIAHDGASWTFVSFAGWPDGSVLTRDSAETGGIGYVTLGALAALSTVNNANWSGTDLAVANGGTGASDAATARLNLGLKIGTDVQAYDADLTAIAGLVSAADRGIYYTGAGTASLFTLSAFGRSLIDDADAAAARTTLGLAIGTNVLAYNSLLDAASGIHAKGDMLVFDGSVWTLIVADGVAVGSIMTMGADGMPGWSAP